MIFSKTETKILFVMLLLAFLIRIPGFWSDLPHSTMSTEVRKINLALKMGAGYMPKDYLTHPPFFAYILLVGYGVLFVVGRIFGFFGSITDYQTLYFTDPTIFYVIARTAVLALSVSSILVLYLIGKRLYGKKISLVACLFMTVLIVHVKWSHFSTGDIPAAFFSLVAFYYVIGVFQRARLKDYMLAGLFIGIATATKYNAAIMIVPFLIAHIFNVKYSKQKMFFPLNKKLFFGLLLAIAIFLLCCPYALKNLISFEQSFQTQFNDMHSTTYNFPSWRAASSGWIYIPRYIVPASIGLFLAILSIGSLVWAILKGKREDWLIIGYILILYLGTGSWTLIKPRYYLVVSIFLLLLNARFIVEFIWNANVIKRKYQMLGFLCLLFLIEPAIIVTKYSQIITNRPVTADAREWIEKNIPPGVKIVSVKDVPLSQNVVSVERELRENVEEHIGEAIRLKFLYGNPHLLKNGYDVIWIPYPWEEDYDAEDLDFKEHLKYGVRFFVLNEAIKEYLSYPSLYRPYVEYINSVKNSCVLIKELRKFKPATESKGYTEGEGFVQIYEYQK